MKNLLIISGGTIEYDFALTFMLNHTFDHVIVADKGMEFAKSCEIHPDLIVGDFDSVNQEALDYYEQQQIPIKQFNPVKDATDSQIALEYAVSMKPEHIWILGGTGSRLDHVLGNIHILKIALDAGIDAHLIDGNNKITLYKDNFTVKKEGYKYISFFPLGANVKHLTLKGFKYELNEYDLNTGSSLTVSNEITDEMGEVSFQDGTVICIQSMD